MTTNKKEQKLARARQRETGESYTTALAWVRAQHAKGQPKP